MPQHVAAPTIPAMIHCSTVFTQELPQFPSPTILTLPRCHRTTVPVTVPPCQPLPPGEIIPSPVACSFPHWRWFTRAVVAAVQSIFNILFNGCQRGCVPGRKCCSSAIVRIPFPLPLGTGDAAISDEFSGKFQRGRGSFLIKKNMLWILGFFRKNCNMIFPK